MAKKQAQSPTRAEVARSAEAAASRVAARRTRGPADRPVTDRIEEPLASEAQLAAGPHRPEPARPVRNDPGSIPPARAAAPRSNARIKVRATQTGYYDEKRQRTGDVFVIHSEKDFSHTWMEHVGAQTPERITTGQQEIRRKHDEHQAGVLAGTKSTGAADPLGSEE